MDAQQTPLGLYEQRLRCGDIRPDPVQKHVVQSLQRLYDDIMEMRAAPRVNFFQKLTGLGRARDGGAPLGVYMHGGVGRGKSMLMDLFFSCLPEDIPKSRVHFHQFMIDAHDYINTRRDADGIREGVDATLPLLAERIAEKSRILCFDEFHVTDIADAMVLGRLFTALFDRDVLVVATSNWKPDALYEGGLQRERFLPFIGLLKRKLEVLHLDSPTDYRAEMLVQEGSYFYPLGPKVQEQADHVFDLLCEGQDPQSDIIEVKGRVIEVERCAPGLARFTFAQLCEQPHGAEDFLAIAQRYPTVFLEGIPKMGYDRRNEVMRLMKFIDALYEAGVRLIVTADAPPDALYHGSDHAYEFERTISRLNEMQSDDYLT